MHSVARVLITETSASVQESIKVHKGTAKTGGNTHLQFKAWSVSLLSPICSKNVLNSCINFKSKEKS